MYCKDYFQSLLQAGIGIVNYVYLYTRQSRSCSKIKVINLYQFLCRIMARKLDAHTKVVQLLLALRKKINDDEGDLDENDDIPPG